MQEGHFFTAVVDADAVLFAYVERHTSEAVKALFGEFRGLLQADASAVYEVLARGRPPTPTTASCSSVLGALPEVLLRGRPVPAPAGVQGLMRIRSRSTRPTPRAAACRGPSAARSAPPTCAR
ncbi:MAG: transposase [Kofleriaceae bacterium]|nr:transposase [Kofleriaceae bacterium]